MSENPVHHFKSVCPNCKQEVEFLSIFSDDQLCANCQYAPKKKDASPPKKPAEFGWTLHPDCRQVLNKQTQERQSGARTSSDLKAIRRLKKARALRRG